MSVFKGEKLNIEIYGESHAESIGAKVSGFPRFKIDFENLKNFTLRRKANSKLYSTKRIESDTPIFQNCGDNGLIDGDFEVIIHNENVKSSDYSTLYAKPRPSHADYVRYIKYGEKDFSGGGKFSGRLTAPLCVVGGIAKQYLYDNYGIKVLGYLSSVGKIEGVSYKNEQVLAEDIENCHKEFPALKNGLLMQSEIERANEQGDSVGATVECVVFNMQCGIGENLFGGLEGKISYMTYAIPGVKGVEFGDGFEISSLYGSQANDSLICKNGKVQIETNHAGGINGGISNGNPLTLRVGFRPTPSIEKEQQTVDLDKFENVKISVKGRHDSCFAVRAVPVVESVVAIAILDSILAEIK